MEYYVSIEGEGIVLTGQVTLTKHYGNMVNKNNQNRIYVGYLSNQGILILPYKNGVKEMRYFKHFGVNVLGKSSGLKLTRENYIEKVIFSSSRIKEHYTDSVIKERTEARLYNYDKNMEYFRSLSKEEFNEKLMNFISKNINFKEITDLATVDRKSGYYLLVLDEFSQVYIGTSGDIKARIQQHWRKQMYFDRMIFGSKVKSILSIDSFRALDTTRIFVYLTAETYDFEDKLITEFDNGYLLNRTAGGRLDGLSEAIANRKTRD